MRARAALLAAALPALGGCARLIFLPSRETLSRLERLEGQYEAVTFPSADGTPLAGLFFPAQGGPARATVVHFHGNAENMTSHFLYAYWLVSRGYNLLAFDYRGYGRSGGRPSVEGAVADGRAALRYARSRRETPGGRLVVFGQSLGGALAVPAAALEPEGISALVLESPFSSYRKIAQDKLARLVVTWPLQWPLSLLFSDAHAPLRYAQGLPRVPVLIVHGDKDRVVPVRHSRALHAALSGPKEYWAVPGGGHTEAFSRLGQEHRPRLLAFLDAALSAELVPYGDGRPRAMRKNRLADQKSPYLLQHADNPVDWRPWGPEAIAAARREGKPILLSIGYSTCHWCHVMERESFEDPAIAEVMNRHFVSIKLDREERPDLDKVYMSAVQAMTGQGGWPLNVFLTPDLKPFFGGTYFPPRARWGRPGWVELLERIAELWKTKRADVEGDAAKLSEALAGWLAQAAPPSKLEAAWLDKAYESLRAAHDRERGGFGGAPKFPMPGTLAFLLRYHARTGEPEALAMALKTLREMSRGGIYDQLGGGFHRYSTDAQWRVPHFEKMLYDNAQLASVLLEAHQASGDPSLAAAARGTLDYALRDLARPEGGFSSAEDADSVPPEGGEKAEGAFYLWTRDEVEELLGKDAEAFIARYGIEAGGNAPADPHEEFAGKNILYDAQGRGNREEKSLESAREKMLVERGKRVRPGLDDKVLTSWNGLMISALAKGGAALREPRYLEAAARAARFLKDELYDAKAGRLYHRWRDGERAVPGQADDYAFLVQGLLDLYEASFDLDWLDWAERLTREQGRLFASKSGGLYLTAEGDDPHLLVRVIDDSDGVEPAASSVAALNLLRLSQLLKSDEHRRAAERLLEAFASRLSERPSSLATMLCAVDFALAKPRQVVLAAEREDPGLAALLREVHARFLPVKALLLADARAKARLGGALPFLKGMVPLKGRAAAYVCVDYSCRLPTADAATLGRLLDGKEAP